MAHILTDSEFKAKVLDAKGVVLVDFGAEWCPPCKALEPIVDELAKELDGKAAVFRMDVDQHPEHPAMFGVRGLPTVLVFKDGQMIERLVGLRPKKALLAAVEKGL